MTRRDLVAAASAGVLLMALLFTWAVGMPLFAAPDEPSHLFKAYGTAHGQATGTVISEDLSNIRRFDVPEEMGQSPGIMCWVFQSEVSVGCQTPGHVGAGDSAAAVYPPFWYALVGGGARVLGQSTEQYAYRGVGAALCAALIAAALAIAWRSPASRFTPLLLLGLPPMAVFLAGSVNPNGFEIAGFLLLWSICLHAGHDRAATTRGGLLVGGLVAMLLVSRFASAIWVATGAVVVALSLGRSDLRRFFNRRFLAAAVGSSGAGVLLVLGWSLYAGAEAEDPRLATSASVADVAMRSLERTPEYLRQMIGILGWLDTPLPWTVHAAYALLTVVALIGVVRSRDPRLVRAAVAACVGIIALPIGVNVASAGSAGMIWQGRYTLPLLGLLGVLGMLGWQRTFERQGSASAPRVVSLVAVSCFCIAEVTAFWQMLRRFTVGSSGKVWLDPPLPWQPPIEPLVLIAINAVLVTAFALLVLHRSAEPQVGGGPHPGSYDSWPAGDATAEAADR